MILRLDIIDFFDSSNRSLVHRVPQMGSTEIPYGAQLIVQQNQEAVFFCDGRAQDAFGPGRHSLVTENLPMVSRWLKIAWERTPFQGAVYFVGKQTFIDQRWGTRQPILLRDRDFGMVRLRGFGQFSYRVRDASVLINSLVGTQDRFTTDEVIATLRDLIVTKLTDVLAAVGIGLLDLPARFDDVALAARVKLADDFGRYGLELVDFMINAMSPPEEVQRAIDGRSGWGAAGIPYASVSAQPAEEIPRLGQAPVGKSDASREEDRPKADARGLVRGVAERAGWSYSERDGGQAEILVRLAPTRQQRVIVDFTRKDSENCPLLHFRSICGPATPDNALTFLRWNRQLAHGAFCVEPSDGGELMVLAASQMAETADPWEVTRQVAAIAWQADQVEQQLLGSDGH